jgi:hypothetical protein
MANIAEILGRLTAEELDGLRGLGPQGHLTKALVGALDRAAGGAGAGRGYYVPTGSVSETGGPHLVLRSDVSAWLFGSAGQVPQPPPPAASGPGASGPAASGPAADQTAQQ